MKILITGASGFFGKSLISALEKTSCQFECIAVYKSTPLQFYDLRFKSIKCDLLNIASITKLIEDFKPTHLIHLAWYVTPQKFWGAKENIDWMHVSIKLFQTFCENNGQVFIGAGTLAEYDWSEGILDEETTDLRPSTLYGQSKKSLHEIILSIKKSFNYEAKIIWPRIGYFFGIDEPKEKLITMLINNIKNELPANLASTDFKRPYAHVRYFGEIITKLIMFNDIDDLTFNMSNSKSYSLKEIVDFIKNNFKESCAKINYDSYKSEPVELLVGTGYFKKIGFEMQDTFFEDLQTFISYKKNA